MSLNNAKVNFETILRACKDDELALMECTDNATGKPVAVVCAVSWDGQEFIFTPLAKMFDGNPYEQVSPPIAEAA